MGMFDIRPFFIAIVCLGLACAAQADETVATPAPAPEAAPATVFSFGRENPVCAEWSNGCQVCTRSAKGEMQCSTPGIACTPGPPLCRVTKEP